MLEDLRCFFRDEMNNSSSCDRSFSGVRFYELEAISSESSLLCVFKSRQLETDGMKPLIVENFSQSGHRSVSEFCPAFFVKGFVLFFAKNCVGLLGVGCSPFRV